MKSENNSKSSIEERKSLRIAIAGGGTGGHLFPGIAIAQEFMRRDLHNEIIFISTGNPLEKRILSKLNYALERITVEGIKGRGWWNQFTHPGENHDMQAVVRFQEHDRLSRSCAAT